MPSSGRVVRVVLVKRWCLLRKRLQSEDNASALFVQRDMELLKRLRKLLRRLFCPLK